MDKDMTLRDWLPELYEEVENLLRQAGRDDLLAQLPDLKISGRCTCSEDFCSTFQVEPFRELNIVETNVIGLRHKESVALDVEKGMVVVDVDNFSRITAFEVLYRPDVEEALQRALGH